MLKKFGQNLNLQCLRTLLKFKKNNDVLNMFECIRNAKKVLLLYPKEKELTDIIKKDFEKFRQHFKDAEITRVLFNYENTKKKSKNNVFYYQESDITFLGNLNKKIKTDLLKNNYDIVIDLSLPFNYINTYIAIKINAPLKIGFNHEKRDDFYNFVIRLGQDHSMNNALQVLFRYLNI